MPYPRQAIVAQRLPNGSLRLPNQYRSLPSANKNTTFEPSTLIMPGYSRPQAVRPQREKNFFVVSGLPEHFNWQKLKDLVRDATTNQPGWTNMDESWNGPEGSKGYFSVKSDQDAASVYHLLVVVMFARLGRQLLVHHFDAASPTPMLLMCNCSSYYPGATGHSDNRSRITARSVLAAQNIPDWQPITPGPYVSIQMQHPGMTVPISMPPQMPMYSPPVTYYQPTPAVTAPVNSAMTNEHGLPINAANGVVRTESRGLHISGLPFNVSETEVRELLRPYGRPLGADLRRGYAIVRFGSMDEVRRAVERLDKVTWKGRQISVKEDRDSTSVSEPVIVNGAPQRRNRPADR